MAAHLSTHDRHEARRLVIESCHRLLLNPQAVHYTQDAVLRWDGINHRKGIHKAGFWPYYGDCSSTATWVLWRSLYVPFRCPDVVNGAEWRYGYTGTQLQHGEEVGQRGIHIVGALVIYGHGHPGEHVAVSLGDGTVMSHGSEGGPYRLAWNYRPDVLSIRDYIGVA